MKKPRRRSARRGDTKFDESKVRREAGRFADKPGAGDDAPKKLTVGAQRLKDSGVTGEDRIAVQSSRVRKYQGHDTVEGFASSHPRGRAYALRVMAADHKAGRIKFEAAGWRPNDGGFRAHTVTVTGPLRGDDYLIGLGTSKKYPLGITVEQFVSRHPKGRSYGMRVVAADMRVGRLQAERERLPAGDGPRGPRSMKDPEGPQPGDQDLNFGNGTSPAFRAQVRGAWKKVPPPVRRALRQAQVAVHSPARLIDVAPDLADQHPRGWLPGSTWKEVDGAYIPGLRRVIVSETALLRVTGKYQPTGRADTVLTHEIGHAYDDARRYESRTAAFRSAYDADVARYLRTGGTRDGEHRYFLQPGDAGPSEMFAETFSELVNGTPVGRVETLTSRFPRVAAHIRKLIGGA
ncbi:MULTISPECIES: hypothetical protein [Methylorubrum]|uniref:hypothetical protein n=1 Tax=Methylorubrum TaxID=2282523 RepID=UPI0020A1A0FB|nr:MULTISPECIES: hypothetical protein [Methylorubrum]MCP1550695.1 hypothetical protein [Methylorubrum zatmanii]MCP1552692.1 hypothetical protein [Methylorubrum extorquens]MCP1580998.1 hypothetical protein [Methylorubrum extorquens]